VWWWRICLQQGADLHMAQLIPLPLTFSCFRKILIGFTFLAYRLTRAVPDNNNNNNNDRLTAFDLGQPG